MFFCSAIESFCSSSVSAFFLQSWKLCKNLISVSALTLQSESNLNFKWSFQSYCQLIIFWMMLQQLFILRDFNHMFWGFVLKWFFSWAGCYRKYVTHDLIQSSHCESIYLFFFFFIILKYFFSLFQYKKWLAERGCHGNDMHKKTAAAHPFIYLSYHSARVHTLLEKLLNDSKSQIICRSDMKMLLWEWYRGKSKLFFRRETSNCNSETVKLLYKF